MKKAVLVDLHNTLLNGDENKTNKIIVNLVNELHNEYTICIITARNIADPERIKNLIRSHNIKFDDFYYLNHNELDDATKKVEIYNALKNKLDIKLLIDNNKECCKAFHTLGIDYLRFKKG